MRSTFYLHHAHFLCDEQAIFDETDTEFDFSSCKVRVMLNKQRLILNLPDNVQHGLRQCQILLKFLINFGDETLDGLHTQCPNYALCVQNT